jgi:hypothetical protein
MKQFELRRLRTPGKEPTAEQVHDRLVRRERARLKRDEKLKEEAERRAKRSSLFKPCKFCGCDLAEVPYPTDRTPFVQCPACNATGPTGGSEMEAINKWNAVWVSTSKETEG